MIQLAYAGIGPRHPPPDVLGAIPQLAHRLTAEGWHLHTGAAEGLCDAFAAATPSTERTRYVPWLGYRGLSGPDCITLNDAELRQCFHVGAEFHPRWKRARASTRKRLAHDMAVLLGADTRTPVHAILTWTPLGQPTPDTAAAERIAHAYSISFLNMATLNPDELKRQLEWIAHNLHSGSSHLPCTSTTSPE